MKIHSALRPFLECMKKWEKIPTLKAFDDGYFRDLKPHLEPIFDDAADFYSVLEDLNWDEYRRNTLSLDPEKEEARLKKSLKKVENLFGFTLEGETILFSSFLTLDGYARFDQGTHRVFLGVDENHGASSYLDILMTHELTHVARESRHSVWEGFGLNPLMTHDRFTESQPVIEHLMGEGFSCAVSEILNPNEDPWLYGYQTEKSLKVILKHTASVDLRIHHEILHVSGDYGGLYSPMSYTPRLPVFTHYVWAWQWAKHVLKNRCNGDARKLVGMSSQNLVQDALNFRLSPDL